MAWEQLQPLSKWVQRQPLGLARRPWRQPLGSWNANEGTPSPTPGMVAPKPVATPALGFHRPSLMPSVDGGSLPLPIPGGTGVAPAIQAFEDAPPFSPSPALSEISDPFIGNSPQSLDAPNSPGLSRIAAPEPEIQTRSENPIPSGEYSPESNSVEPGLPQDEPVLPSPVPSGDWPILVQRQPLGHHRPLAPRPSLARDFSDLAADLPPVQLQPDDETLTIGQLPEDGESISGPAPATDLRSPTTGTPVIDAPSPQLTPQPSSESPAARQPVDIQATPLRNDPIAKTIAGDEVFPSPASLVRADLQENPEPELSTDASPEAPSLQPQAEVLSADATAAITPEVPAPPPQPETSPADSGADVPAETSPGTPNLQSQLEAPLTDSAADTTLEVPTLQLQGETAAADSVHAPAETATEPPSLQPQLETETRLADSPTDPTAEAPTLQPEGESPSADIAAAASSETLTEFPSLQPQVEAPLSDSPAASTPEEPTLQPLVGTSSADSPGVPTESSPEPRSLQPQLKTPLTDSPAKATLEEPTLQPRPETSAAKAATALPEPDIQLQSQTAVEVSPSQNYDAQVVPEADAGDIASDPNLLSPSISDAELASSSDLPEPSPTGEPAFTSPLTTDDIIQPFLHPDTEPELAGTVPTARPEVMPQAELQEAVAADKLPLTGASADEPAVFEAEEKDIAAAYQTEVSALHETFPPTIPGERPPNLQPSDLQTSPSEQTSSLEPTPPDTDSFSTEHPSLQVFPDSQATDAPGILIQQAEQKERTAAKDKPQTEVPQPDNQGSDRVEQATSKLQASQNPVLQARKQEPWQDQFKLEPGPSPTSLKPWQQQFQMDAPVEQLSTSAPPGIAPKEDVAAAAAVSHQLISPIAKSVQSEPGEKSQVSDQQLEQLAHICYGLVRSHLLTSQEFHYGINNLGPSWADISFLPSLAAKPDSETQTSMDIKTLELNALSLAWDKNISELCQEIQGSLQFRMTLERDRSPGKAFTRLGR